MRGGCLNVRGTIPKYEQLMDIFKLDFLATTETWATNQANNTDYQLHLPGRKHTNCYRQSGGVSLYSKSRLRLVHKLQSDHCQALITRLYSDLQIIVVYLPPQQSIDTVTNSLELLSPYVRGRTVLTGDFNAQHHSWSRSSNVMGNILQKWSKKHSVQIGAPATPTCRNSTTIDLFLGKGISFSSTSTQAGSWSTDHDLVTTSIQMDKTWKPPRLSKHVVNDEIRRKIATSYYNRVLPTLIANINTSDSDTKLDNATQKVANALLHPFADGMRIRPRRFRNGWSTQLDKLAKQRSKLLKKRAMRSNNGQNSEATTTLIRDLDKKIATTVRRNKIRIQHKIMTNLEGLSPVEMGIQFHRNRNLHTKTNQPKINGDEYQQWMISTQTHNADIGPVSMELPDDFEETIEKALKSAKLDRAPGPDSVLSELLTIHPKLSCEFITALWKKVGELRHLPPILNTGFVIPLYKKDDPTIAKNYRPITLLSHIRKVISIAVNIRINELYKFHKNQFGFSPKVGTETATCLVHSLLKKHKYVAVLDLEQAYPSVHRDILLKRAKRLLPTWIANMIQNLLTDVHFTSLGQSSFLTGKMTMGVPQGDPVSPTLYNLFMDSFLELMDTIPETDSEAPAIAFADDVTLASRSSDGLRTLLSQSEKWTSQNSMKWAAHKCVILGSDNIDFTFCNITLNKVCNTTYLGTTISLEGVTGDKILSRIKAAIATIRRWRNIEENTFLLPRNTKILLTKMVLLPMIDFGIQLCPLSNELRLAHQSFQLMLCKWIVPKTTPSQIPRALATTGILDVTYRRKILQHTRLQNIYQHAISAETDTAQPNDIKERTSRFFQLFKNHSHLQEVVKATTPTPFPIPKNNAISTNENISHFNKEIYSQAAFVANHRKRRQIPVSSKPPIAYRLFPKSTLIQNFLNKWYLNQLGGLNNSSIEYLKQTLMQHTLSEAQIKELRRRIPQIMTDSLQHFRALQNTNQATNQQNQRPICVSTSLE